MNDIAAMIVVAACGFILGRLTYTPERWVEDRMGDIEKNMFDRMSNFLADRVQSSMNRMKDQIMDSIEGMKAGETIKIQAENKEGAARQMIQEFRKRHIPEEEIKEHVREFLKIEEDLYERIARE